MDRQRKLPKCMRRANLIYKIIMALVSGASLFLTSFTEINPLYYQVVSIIGTAFPIVWSQILDAAKQYVEQSSPVTSPTNKT